MLLRPRTWLPRTRFLMASTLAFTIGVSLSHCANTLIGYDVTADAGTYQPNPLSSLTVSPANAVLQVDANHTTADRTVIAEAKAMGLRIVGWPTNSQEELESVLTLHPDLFCTDRPSLLTDLYAATVETTGA